MKSRHLIAMAWLLLVGFGADESRAHELQKGNTLVVAADYWCPYNCEGSEQGYVVDLLKGIFEPKGIKVEYQLLSWNRALEELQSGHVHAVIGARKSEVKGGVFPEEPVGNSRTSFFVQPGNPSNFSLEGGFKNQILGAIDDYDYGDALDVYISKNRHNTEKVQLSVGKDATLQNIRKLVAGRVNVVLEDDAVMRYELKKSGMNGAVVKYAEFNSSDSEENLVYVCFSPALKMSKEYAAMLDEGIREWRENGKLKELLQHYGSEDLQLKGAVKNGSSK